jgi:hypothetical protein
LYLAVGEVLHIPAIQAEDNITILGSMVHQVVALAVQTLEAVTLVV